ncbi:12836_t:CDS:2, partial [Dentiscutata heterogama]
MSVRNLWDSNIAEYCSQQPLSWQTQFKRKDHEYQKSRLKEKVGFINNYFGLFKESGNYSRLTR